MRYSLGSSAGFQIADFVLSRDLAVQFFGFQENREGFAEHVPPMLPPGLETRPRVVGQHQSLPADPDLFIQVTFFVLATWSSVMGFFLFIQT
jgi:hypothetical protein